MSVRDVVDSCTGCGRHLTVLSNGDLCRRCHRRRHEPTALAEPPTTTSAVDFQDSGVRVAPPTSVVSVDACAASNALSSYAKPSASASALSTSPETADERAENQPDEDEELSWVDRLLVEYHQGLLEPLWTPLPPLPDNASPMSDHAHDDEVQRMSDLFDRATKTTPALSAVNRLAHCHLVDRLTNGDLETALEVWADPGTIKAAEAEFHSLDEDGRADLAALIVPTWSAALTVAVHHLWASCRRLGFDPTGLDAEHVALTATMFRGGDLQALIDEVAEDGGA